MLYQGYVARLIRRELMDDAFIGRRAVSLRISRLEDDLKQVEDELCYLDPIRQLLTQSKEPLFTNFFVQNTIVEKQTAYLRGIEITSEVADIDDQLSKLDLLWLDEQRRTITALGDEIKALNSEKEEKITIRDSYNEAAIELEKQQLVQLEWVKGRPLLLTIALRLDQIMQCYSFAERVHPKVRASQVANLIDSGLEGVTVPWIVAWKTDACRVASEQLKVPPFCKTDNTLLQNLLCSFREYAALPGSITMRAFSSKCFSDTKYFERNVRDWFLKIAKKYNADLALSCDENELGEKEQLAFLGIYARPELYELAGNCNIRTYQGDIYVGAAP